MKIRCLAFLALLGAALTTDNSIAAIIQDFQFSESGAITGAVNSASPGNNFLAQSTSAEYSMNGAGAFHIVKGTPTGQVGNTFDIANVTSGKVWLVAEISGWLFTETPSSTSERVRFGFLDNDPPAAGSSTITAQMQDRSAAEQQFDHHRRCRRDKCYAHNYRWTRSVAHRAITPLTLVLGIDADADTYTISYKDGASPFATLGTGNLGERSAGVLREARSVRFAFTGQFNDTDEFFDVDRIYVTDTNPIPEPAAALLLCVAATLGLVLRRRAA